MCASHSWPILPWHLNRTREQSWLVPPFSVRYETTIKVIAPSPMNHSHADFWTCLALFYATHSGLTGTPTWCHTLSPCSNFRRLSWLPYRLLHYSIVKQLWLQNRKFPIGEAKTRNQKAWNWSWPWIDWWIAVPKLIYRLIDILMATQRQLGLSEWMRWWSRKPTN